MSPKEVVMPELGDRFGRWTVCGSKCPRPGYIRVRCACGRDEWRPLHLLRSGKSTQCADCAYAERNAPLQVALRQLNKLSADELQQLQEAIDSTTPQSNV